jgi:hypothetical protein
MNIKNVFNRRFIKSFLIAIILAVIISFGLAVFFLPNDIYLNPDDYYLEEGNQPDIKACMLFIARMTLAFSVIIVPISVVILMLTKYLKGRNNDRSN